MTIKKTIRGIRDSIPGGYVLGRIGGLGSGPPSLIKFTPNSTGGVGGSGARRDATIVHNNVSTNFTVGNTSTANPIGTITSGTVTPNPALGNMQSLTDNGAFTLAAPTASNDYLIYIALTMGSTAGTITTTGFKIVTGDPITLNNGDEFMLRISKVNGIKWLDVVAMQLTFVTHRYWGVRSNANQGSITETAINNIEMAETHYGPNVLPVGGVGHETSGEGAPYGPSNALISADTQSGHQFWYAYQTNTPIWYYDFGASNGKIIKRVTLIGTTNSANYNIKDMDVVYSDDAVTWTTAWTENSLGMTTLNALHHSYDVGAPTYTGSPWNSHPYWRTYMTDPTDFVAIAELVFEATSGGGQQATGGTPLADTSSLGVVANAFDNDPTTYWGTSTGFSAWVQYHFPSSVIVRDFSVQSRQGTQSVATNCLFLRFSDDGTQFTTVFRTADQPPYTAGEIRTFVDPLFI